MGWEIGRLSRLVGWFANDLFSSDTNHILQVEDTNPFSLTGQLSDVTQVEKFEISEAEYAKRSGTPHLTLSLPPIWSFIHALETKQTRFWRTNSSIKSAVSPPHHHLPLTLQQFKPPLRFHSTPGAKSSQRKKACINAELCVLWVLPSLGRVFGWVLSMMSLWGRMTGRECSFLFFCKMEE